MAHHKALVDIISMVKRAAFETSPLLTAEERVNEAVGAWLVTARSLPSRPSGWSTSASIWCQPLDRARGLRGRAGAVRPRWVGRANRVFDGQLAELLGQLNKELVAA